MEASVNAARTTRRVSVSSSGIQPSVSVARPHCGKLRMEVSANNASQNVRSRFAWRAGYLLAALGIYFADQASKAWAVRTLRFGDERVVIPGFFRFLYTENSGIAFGQLQDGGSFNRGCRHDRGLLLFSTNSPKRRFDTRRMLAAARRHCRQPDRSSSPRLRRRFHRVACG